MRKIIFLAAPSLCSLYSPTRSWSHGSRGLGALHSEEWSLVAGRVRTLCQDTIDRSRYR
jgi:hypothetical protein